jgi:hypothetical protein
MALKKTFEHCGVTVKEGYLKVAEIAGTKNSMGFSLAYKANVENDAIKTERFNFVPSMDANFIEQAYLHLKSLPEFQNAVDC